jgi:hypothetical protein
VTASSTAITREQKAHKCERIQSVSCSVKQAAVCALIVVSYVRRQRAASETAHNYSKDNTQSVSCCCCKHFVVQFLQRYSGEITPHVMARLKTANLALCTDTETDTVLSSVAYDPA